jgi:hypothetical protein
MPALPVPGIGNETVLAVRNVPEHLLELAQDFQKDRIHVADHGLDHGAIDAGVHFTRPGPHQQALGKINGMNMWHRKPHLCGLGSGRPTKK